jgi:GNAT superfamily N-acetyltransferase
VSLVDVRDATAEDAEALSRIHAETWRDTYVGQVSDALAHDGIARAKNRDWVGHADLRVSLGGGVLVLLHAGAVVGFCEFGPTEDPDDDPRRVGHIMRVYVLPAYQGQGGGRLLLESACARLTKGGFDNATLWTLQAESNRAHGFYRRLGWTREDVLRDDDPDDIRYRRDLL